MNLYTSIFVRIIFLLASSQLVLCAFSELTPNSDSFLTKTHNSKFNANVAEKIMDDYFKNSYWLKIRAEVDVNGIDGLYNRKENDRDSYKFQARIIDVLHPTSVYEQKKADSIKCDVSLERRNIEKK